MTETGNKTVKQEQDSNNESGAQTTEQESCKRRTGIASSEQEDSQRGDLDVCFGRWHNGSARGLSVVLEQRSWRSRAGDLEQDFDR